MCRKNMGEFYSADRERRRDSKEEELEKEGEGMKERDTMEGKD